MRSVLSRPAARRLVRAALAAAPLAALGAPLGAARAQTVVYTQNFESGSAGAAWSGAGTVQTAGGLSAFGFGQQHLRNDVQAASVLTLSGLAAHTTMRLSFDLAMWDTIDFNQPDRFVVTADGVALFDGTFGNYFTTSGQCEGPGTRLTPDFTGFATPNYGYGAGARDCARAVVFDFAHSASSVVFTFAYPNSQGGLDESFGLDNVRVETNAVAAPPGVVPEPSTWALVAAGLAALGAGARRRARAG